MSYQCPKGHMSTDADYCSECGARIGQVSTLQGGGGSMAQTPKGGEICPDCGTPRVGNDRFCEVCRHDFVEGKTVPAEKVVAVSQGSEDKKEAVQESVPIKHDSTAAAGSTQETAVNTSSADPNIKITTKNDIIIAEKFNIIISVDKGRLAQNQVETNIKPDSKDRVFPLDLDENLVGRRSVGKGIYPEIEINDPGVSHRHLKFIKQGDGSFAALELGSANGTEHNGVQLEAGVSTQIKAGDEFAIGLWTTLKVVSR